MIRLEFTGESLHALAKAQMARRNPDTRVPNQELEALHKSRDPHLHLVAYPEGVYLALLDDFQNAVEFCYAKGYDPNDGMDGLALRCLKVLGKYDTRKLILSLGSLMAPDHTIIVTVDEGRLYVTSAGPLPPDYRQRVDARMRAQGIQIKSWVNNTHIKVREALSTGVVSDYDMVLIKGVWQRKRVSVQAAEQQAA